MIYRICLNLTLTLCLINLTHAKSILFLGDSYTIGTGLDANDKDKSFPALLIQQLRNKKITIEKYKIYAVDGDTTKHLLGALNVAEPQSNPDSTSHDMGNADLVILSIGINDLFRGDSKEDYAHHFKELLARAIHFAKGDASRVIVLSIPPWDVSPSVFDQSGPKFRIAKYPQVEKRVNEILLPIKNIRINKNGHAEILLPADEVRKKITEAQEYNTQTGIRNGIDSFNQAARQVINQENAHSSKKIVIIDITATTRSLSVISDGKSLHPDKTLFSSDGIHYSPLVYEKWVEMMLSSVMSVLKQSEITNINIKLKGN